MKDKLEISKDSVNFYIVLVKYDVLFYTNFKYMSITYSYNRNENFYFIK